MRGVEATPLAVDGIMYVSASWSVVHAIDARTGKRICTPWDSITYDPDLNMIYIGTGNGSPWKRNLRSPPAVTISISLHSLR
jgi:glucose dehydrogenase